MSRDEINREVQDFCAFLHERGAGWTPVDAARVADMLNADEDPWGLFRFMDERTGDWRVGYKTRDGREYFHILRQMRNRREGGLFEYLRRA